MYLNLFIVWLFTGFWHGADWNFVIWGLYYFIFISVERLLFNKKDGLLLFLRNREWPAVIKIFVRILGHIYAVFIVAVGWAIFAITDLSQLGDFMKRLFAPFFGQPLAGMEMSSFSWVMYVWLAVGALFSSTFPAAKYEKIRYRIPATIILFALFWLSVVQLTDGAYNPFLYFRF
jgi:alginate O-acetyltransferase complex protein AlgI